jgi:hypothetical protein
VGVGSYALYGVTTGANNSGFGQETLQSNTTGSANVAVGTNALNANTTADYNTALGYRAMYNSTTAAASTAVGSFALNAATTGSSNTAVGYNALASNTTGVVNTAVGHNALASVTTSNYNIGMGYQAGYYNTTGGYNVFLGAQAGFNSTSGQNTFVGQGAGYLVLSGASNTILGCYNGNQGGLDIRTASNNIVLSDGDGNPRAYQSSTGGWYQYNNSASWSTTSDARLKKDVQDITNGLEIITALRPVEFNYIISGKHDKGFLAQEYELVLPDQITNEDNGTADVKALTNGDSVKGIQRNLDPYFVSAIKTLTAKVEQLTAEIATLKGAA